ncbi:MAG: pentapeptide repeat-containing protein [Lactobacillus sp.]|nr:pentapeptide repeat-containing protein [Lactobacillus sp.]MCI2031989.1 pentapeptide repeat-containing protein [Lactobacillus sp.]
MQKPKITPELTPLAISDWPVAEPYLQGVAVAGGQFDSQWRHHPTIENSRVQQVDFTAMQAERFEASDVVFTHCDWANTDLSEAAFYRVRFDQCRLTGVDLSQAYLSEVVFTDCQMDLAWLPEATLKTVTFVSCRLAHAELSRGRITHLQLQDCAIDRLGLLGLRLKGWDLTSCQFATLDADVSGLQGLQVTASQAENLARRYLGLAVETTA